MKKLLSSSNIRSILSWLIKLGTMGFNLPATLGVAALIVKIVTGNTVTDPLLVLILQISGVVVVDTVFLAAWYELDSNKAQDDSDKLADALTVVSMYVLTIVIGFLHGEGLYGLAFRVPMGIAVARSTWKTISYSMRRTGDDAKGKNLPLRVRWEQMKAMTVKGIAVIQSEVVNFVEDLKAQDTIRATHRATKTRVGNEIAAEMEPIYRDQAVASAKSNNITIVSSPSLSNKSLATSSAITTVQTTTPSSSSSQKYTIEQDGVEWVAACLHPGCSVVVRNGSKDSVRRKIVGHGNKHKGMVVVESVVSDTVPVVDGEFQEEPKS